MQRWEEGHLKGRKVYMEVKKEEGNVKERKKREKDTWKEGRA